MIKKVERVSSNINKIKYREKVEWVNYWYSNSLYNENHLQKRILMIGDSLSRQYRTNLEEITGIPVDFIGVSSLVFDELFLKSIENFFELNPRKYLLINIQIGVHGIVELTAKEEKKEFYKLYKEQYKKIIDFLRDKTGKIVLSNSTEVIKAPSKDNTNKYIFTLWKHFHFKRSEVVDQLYEKELNVRNKIVKDLAIECNVELNDLNEVMKSERKKFKHIDSIHYEKKSKKYFAKKLSEFLK